MAITGVGLVAITDGTTHAKDDAYGKWQVHNEGGVLYYDTQIVNPAAGTDLVLSPAIPGAMVNGQKIMIGFNTTTAGGNVTSDFTIQGSTDGKNWADADGGTNIFTDCTPDVTGVQFASADLTNFRLPWYRLEWNGAGDDATTWQGSFYVGGFVGGNLPLDAARDIGGIGKDPS